MSDIDRLNRARKKVEEIAHRRTRLRGELDVHKQNLSNLEQQAKDDFGCEVDALPELITKLEAEGKAALERAEELLGASCE